MSSKERLCIVCGSFVGTKYDQVIAGTETEGIGGMMHLECAWKTRTKEECDHWYFVAAIDGGSDKFMYFGSNKPSEPFSDLEGPYATEHCFTYCPKCGAKL